LESEESTPSTTEKPSIDVAEIAASLWGARKIITYVVVGATVVAAIVSLLLPNYYLSTATLLPETERSKLASLGNLSDLATLAGLNPGEVSLVKLYPRIITSETVLKNVIYDRYYSQYLKDSVNLVDFLDIKEKTPAKVYEEALKVLRDKLDVESDIKTSIVSISIETKDPKISADIVNNIVYELDKFIRTKRTTNATEQRKWIEARLQEVKGDLERSENALKDFREKNRRVLDSPELLLEQARLGREVEINSALYTELKKQYELIKIEEIKNIPIITVMDAGRPAAWKTRPKRATIVATVFVLSFVAAAGYVTVSSRYKGTLAAFLLKVGIRQM